MISTSRSPYVLLPIVEMSTSEMSEILYDVRFFEASKILFVTLSGAGAPFARLYLIPKSALGPLRRQMSPTFSRMLHTSGVVAGSQQDASCSLPLPDDMTRGRCAEDTVLSDQELLDAICWGDLCNLLDNLWVVVSSITTDDEESSF
jgi:hypothetical protein